MDVVQKIKATNLTPSSKSFADEWIFPVFTEPLSGIKVLHFGLFWVSSLQTRSSRPVFLTSVSVSGPPLIYCYFSQVIYSHVVFRPKLCMRVSWPPCLFQLKRPSDLCFLIHLQEVPDSNVGPTAGLPFFVIFLSPSWKIPGQYQKLRHALSFHITSISLIMNSPIFRSNRANDSVVN